MSSIRKDFYIELLKYANKKNEFILNELFEDLNLNQEEKNLFCERLIHSKLLFDSTSKSDIFMISIKGRFKLLEHEELTEARISSKQAKYIAISAIIISALLAICSILLQVFHRNKP
ncbi:MAG: hypothetical protein ACD_71C00213G0004 [uncultured bacterium (gcode 4)]|uniref:Uncharacterized protein n=1 Tax=uncultured bacterium (gcode 4) TaxID=1234023 RepID=K2A2K6_9BACT|nr:MAG: hypothetical protein ACD_71C00213G0004 [uncultured bacterium (gcode 4)]